jgi:hypothetical protein
MNPLRAVCGDEQRSEDHEGFSLSVRNVSVARYATIVTTFVTTR